MDSWASSSSSPQYVPWYQRSAFLVVSLSKFFQSIIYLTRFAWSFYCVSEHCLVQHFYLSNLLSFKQKKNRHSCKSSRHPGLIFAGACHGQKTGIVTKTCDTARTNLWACEQAHHCARSIGKIHYSEPELRNGKCNECLLSSPGEILEAVAKSLSRINEHTVANVCLHLCFQLRIR